MYAKLKDGKLIKFEGKKLSYTITKDEEVYYVTVINPSEEEFAEAGYYEVVADEEQLKNENTIYTLAGNTIVPFVEAEDERIGKETDIQ